MNRARRDNPALQRDDRLRFHEIDNDSLLWYSKTTADFSNLVVVIVNLDPQHAHAGWVTLDPAALGLAPGDTCHVEELFEHSRTSWSGTRAYVTIDPADSPARLFRLRGRARTERDSDYYVPATGQPPGGADPLWYKDAIVYELSVEPDAQAHYCTTSPTSTTATRW